MDAFQRVLADPGSIAARRALATEWKAKRDPRADLIEKQLALRELHADGDFSSARAKTLKNEIAAIIAQHGGTYAGRVAQLVDKFDFHRGLVAGVTVSGAKLATVAAELLKTAPIQHVNLIAPLGALDKLFAVPELKELVSLSITRLGKQFGDAGAIALARSANASGLRWIDLFDDAIGEAGVEAIAASPYLDKVQYINFDDNPANPTPVADHHDGVYTARRPTLAAELERTYGARPWLALPDKPESWPPSRDAVATTD